MENLSDVQASPQYAFVRGDICDRSLVDGLMGSAKFDVVVDFAAESHMDRSILDAGPFIEANVKGTQVLLEAARSRGIGLFVQVSTAEVYGSLGPNDPPFSEESPLVPSRPYAASKAAGDPLVKVSHTTLGLPVIITRCSNNDGPYQFPEKLN
ncbi:MAG: GDP-mannose 4,6-dehydratase [Bacillota bacterium]